MDSSGPNSVHGVYARDFLLRMMTMNLASFSAAAYTAACRTVAHAMLFSAPLYPILPWCLRCAVLCGLSTGKWHTNPTDGVSIDPGLHSTSTHHGEQGGDMLRADQRCLRKPNHDGRALGNAKGTATAMAMQQDKWTDNTGNI